ncbi:aminotransferase class V-fold PLP-dependent enzyme [Candidatus Uhrbacteria bacterium]|nr:aminotransferase class V-fold PLP-dependent enzyme [Candidatus Uhrbacteria bacterium]
MKVTKRQTSNVKRQEVYLDHAATTPVDGRVIKAMMPFFDTCYGNPSSLHAPGQKAHKAVTDARNSIAGLLNAHVDEMVFCSGGTESDNLAILGTVNMSKAELKRMYGKNAVPHVVTSAIEHPAVLEPLLKLEYRGEIELTQIKPGANGVVAAEDVFKAIKSNTVLVTIMLANNEIGTIQPIAEIGKLILKHRKVNGSIYPYFHTDACQAAGYLDLNVEKLHVDLLTLNGGKIYGPKGVGLLFVRRKTRIEPQVYGGGQERRLRSGTENVPGIAGLATALDIAQAKREKESERIAKLRDRLIKGLLKIEKSRLNGDAKNRLPNNVNVSFMDIEGEAAMLYLDAKGVYCSTGSACASTSLDPSHVILALGMSYEAAHGSMRLTLGKSTTKKDVDYVVTIMPGIVRRLREISPVSLDMKQF